MRNIKKSNPERGWVFNSLSWEKIRCFVWNWGCFLCLLFCFLCLLFWFQGDFCAPWGHHFQTLAVSGNVLISPNPGASWSTTACMWIISATFGMMSLAREYEQIITRSKVTEKWQETSKGGWNVWIRTGPGQQVTLQASITNAFGKKLFLGLFRIYNNCRFGFSWEYLKYFGAGLQPAAETDDLGWFSN